MGAFCVKCGGKLDPGAKFCAQCGQTVAQGPSAPAPAASQPAAAAPAKGGGGAAKIIFAVLGVFAFFVLAAAGSCFYIGYRVRKRAQEFTQTYKSTPYQGDRNACRLATKAEVAAAFHTPVVNVEGEGDDCSYSLGGNNAVAVRVTWEGGTMAMKLSHAALKGIAGGMDTFTALPGVGDEAYVEPMGSGIMLRKGDVMVNIDLRTAKQNADAGKQIAAIIAGRL
ncbi:MAG TPA: zinc ribbon domain-containing protein [Terriglobales bacterium]|nr:zinc ribbon domain-containing protein [Terriglobales bacterium]